MTSTYDKIPLYARKICADHDMTNDIKIAKVVKSHRDCKDCKDCIIIKSNLLNDDSSGPHFVVKFLVVMSLEESLTIVVTHFKKYLTIILRARVGYEMIVSQRGA